MLIKAKAKEKVWRPVNPHQGGKAPTEFPATRFFDQMAYIGNPNVGCFLIETKEGIILLDSMCPRKEDLDTILKGIADLGHELSELKAILITHGHGDHYGCADELRKLCGCTVYMSSVDTEYAKTNPDSPTGPLTWDPDEFIEDGDVFELGGQKVYAFATPGHTVGCLSYIIPVTDCGKPHLTALWGGTGVVMQNLSAKVQYLQSCVYFGEITEAMGVDSAIATHPFVDQSIRKLEIVREIVDGVPNPFVLGKEGYKQYENMFRDLCLNSMVAHAAEADAVLPPRKRPKPQAMSK